MEKMLAVLPEARKSLSEYAPRILTHRIDPEKIGKLIGPGGKTVRGLQENYGVKIDIEEDGTVYISGEGLSAERALAEVQRMTEDIEVGKIYTGTVVRVEPYGAFVNIMPGIDGMVHIGQLADYRVDKVEDIANLGDELSGDGDRRGPGRQGADEPTGRAGRLECRRSSQPATTGTARTWGRPRE
jgi:polyribonucleotide nucleotidyltransferase